MTKKEVIWREILFQSRQNKKNKFTQKELAKKFGFSISTVFGALKIPRDSHAVNVTGRFFVLEDYKKLLYLWASMRSLKRDLYYSGFINERMGSMEGTVPPETLFGLYSAFKLLYSTIPAEYDHFYLYIEEEKLPLFLERLSDTPSKTTYPNFFILKPDTWLRRYPQPLFEQLFVDIWNAPEWYAKDFLSALEKELSV